MARLNVEPEFFADSRFLDLVSLTSDKEKAVGMVVLFWMLAQKCWANGRELVPLEVFKRHKWEKLAEVGLAEIRNDGVYAKGSSQFEWILERKEAGKRGASKTNGLRYGKTQQTSAKLGKSQPLLCSTTALLSSNKDNTRKKKTKVLIKDWPPNHVYARVFSNLNRIDRYQEIFDLKQDDAAVTRNMVEYGLSVTEMESISFKFAEWADGVDSIKSPRGTLSTFAQRYAKDRALNPPLILKEPKYARSEDIV